MKTRMEGKTWEQLLMVLLQITSVILAQAPPNSKKNNLGGRLAQPIFQTLIVTWIRAHTNVNVHSSMWEKFLKVLSSLTHREELIVEWDKTMQTLTRVLARQVYNLNLQDLPLDRLAETKGKRRRVGVPASSVWHQNSQGSAEGNGIAIVNNTNNKKDMIEEHCGTDSTRPHTQLRHHIPGTPMLNRSYSEGSLATPYRKSRARRRIKGHQVRELPAAVEHQLSKINQKSISMETLNISRISQSGESAGTVRRTLSLDSIRQKNEDTDSFRGSRSPSPTASSGIEGGSIKDSPLQIDVLGGGDSSSIETHDDIANADRRSILAGGNAKGWLPDVAAIMWRRMLGSLGDVNKILNPKLHAEVFRYLVNITDSLIKIRLNQGISNDNQSTPLPPSLVPPVGIVLPWCYGAMTLEPQYNQGKMYAMQLLCMIARNSNCLTSEQLPLFYHALHSALTGEDRMMAATALRHLGGPRFLSLLLPGHTLLFLDLVHACTVVLTSSDVRNPRAEVTGLLGSLLCFPKTSLPGPVLQPAEPHIDLMECPDLQEHILNIVLRCARREPTAKARAIALSSLGQWILQNLTNPEMESAVSSGEKFKQSIPTNHSTSQSQSSKVLNPRITEAFQVILQALQFKHRVIARAACETLRLCAEKGVELARIERLPHMIVNALCISLEIQNIPNPKDSDKNVLTSFLLCLGELCMALPTHILMEPKSNDSNDPLVLVVFKVLHRIATGKHGDRVKLFTTDEDFDMTIAVDDIKEQSTSEPNYQTQETIQQCQASIQLCAKTVAMHLVTNISHFPLGIGATRLSSMVDECDDMQQTSSTRESNSVDSSLVIPAPNLQLLMLSSELVASFIELPALRLPGGITGGLVTANRQVRLLLRDLNGKSCWDCSVIYCEPKIHIEATADDEVDFDNSRSFREKSFHSVGNKFAYGNKSFNIGISLDPMISTIGMALTQPPRHTIRHRAPHQLPIANDLAPDLDQLDDLLQYIGFSSTECLDVNNQPLNTAGPSPLGSHLEAQTITILLNQRSMETDFSTRKNQQIMDVSGSSSSGIDVFNNTSSDYTSYGDDVTLRSSNVSGDMTGNRFDTSSASTKSKTDAAPFQYGRLLFSQIGLAGWERRKRTHLLTRTDKLLRELRNLDAQKCRETHKMAVIYVANGQEDKNSILRFVFKFIGDLK